MEPVPICAPYRAVPDAIDHELLIALAKAEDEARRGIGRELRDSTAQHLVAISFGLHNLEFISPQTPDIQAAIADIRASIDAASQEIRMFAYLLNPPQAGAGQAPPSDDHRGGRPSPERSQKQPET